MGEFIALDLFLTPPQGMGFFLRWRWINCYFLLAKKVREPAAGVGSYQDKWSETQVCGIKCRHDNIGWIISRSGHSWRREEGAAGAQHTQLSLWLTESSAQGGWRACTALRVRERRRGREREREREVFSMQKALLATCNIRKAGRQAERL